MVAIFSFFLLVIFGDDSLLELNRVKKERNILIKKNEELARENNSMYNEIERLKHDPEYIENVARRELGMIGKNEIIFKIEKKTESVAAGEKK
ncbi:MAG: septum formation initiator family protein [Desulfobacteraceae bacterium]|nr:MAG: septum formation initiator family protein [Desulfobacteraceae bacterium]